METRKIQIPVTIILPESINLSLCKNGNTFDLIYSETFGQDVPQELLQKTKIVFKTLFDVEPELNEYTLTIKRKSESKEGLKGFIAEIVMQVCHNKNDVKALFNDLLKIFPDTEPIYSPVISSQRHIDML